MSGISSVAHGGAPGARVERQRPHADGLHGRSHLAAGAPHHRPDPGQQLARGEGLRDVVVGAQLEPEDPVGLLAARGQDHDGHVGVGAQLPADVPPVLAREHEVEEHHVVGAAERLGEAGDAVGGAGDHHAVPAEVLGGQGGEAGVVLDEERGQDRVGGHRRIIAALPLASAGILGEEV